MLDKIGKWFSNLREETPVSSHESHSDFVVEELEQRVLLSADGFTPDLETDELNAVTVVTLDESIDQNALVEEELVENIFNISEASTTDEPQQSDVYKNEVEPPLVNDDDEAQATPVNETNEAFDLQIEAVILTTSNEGLPMNGSSESVQSAEYVDGILNSDNLTRDGPVLEALVSQHIVKQKLDKNHPSRAGPLYLAKSTPISTHTPKNYPASISHQAVGDPKSKTSPQHLRSKSANFDGVDDRSTIGLNSVVELTLTTNATWEFWIKFDSISDTREDIIFSSWNFTGGTYNYLLELETNRQLRFHGGGASTYSVDGAVANSNDWQHVAITKSGADVKIYVNAVDKTGTAQVGSHGDLTQGANSAFYFSRHPAHYSNTTFLHGQMDEFKMWNVGLSQSTIQSWYNKELALDHPNFSNTDSDNLVAYYQYENYLFGGVSSYWHPDSSSDGNISYGDGGNTALSNEQVSLTSSTGLSVSNVNFIQDGNDNYAVFVESHGKTGLVTTDLSSDFSKRFSQVWSFLTNDHNNNGGEIRLTFDFSQAGTTHDANDTYKILVRDGTSGNFTAMEFVPSSVSGDQVSFDIQATVLNGKQVTLGVQSKLIDNVAYGFDKDRNVNIAHSAAASIVNGGTWEFWFIMDDTTNTATTLFTQEDGTNNMRIETWTNNRILFYTADNSGSQLTYTFDNAYVANKWHHIAITRSGSTATIYVNGVDRTNVQATHATLTLSGTPSHYINYSAVYPSNQYHLIGRMDEVRFWNSALSQSTIQSWMHRELDTSHPNYNHTSLDNLVGYYRFDDISGTTLNDESGDGHNGAIGGTVTTSSNGAPLATSSSSATASAALWWNQTAATTTASGLEIANVSFLNQDEDQVVIGQIGATSSTNAEYPFDSWSRYWEINGYDATSNGGNITLTFDFSNAGQTHDATKTYALLIRNGSSGSFVELAGVTGTLSGDQLSFTIAASSVIGKQVTLGAFQTPANNISYGFDATKYITINDTKVLNVGNNATWEFWIHFDSFSNDNPVLFTHEENLASGYRLEYWQSKFIYVDEGGITQSTAGLVSTNKWYHVAFVLTGGTSVKIYLNGQDVTNTTVTHSTNLTTGAQAAYINQSTSWAGSANTKLIGSLDDFRIWNTSLSQSTIQSWMNRELTGAHPNFDGTLYDNLLLYYRFDDVSGTTLTDVSGEGNHGTITGTVSQNSTGAPVVVASNGFSTTDTLWYNDTTTSTTLTGLEIGNVSFLTEVSDHFSFGDRGTGTSVTTDLPSGFDARWDRNWGIVAQDISSNGGTIKLTFDFSDVGLTYDNARTYRPIARIGNTGNFAAVTIISTAIVGDQISFDIAIANVAGKNVTLASIINTAPSFTVGSNQSVAEDSAAQSVSSFNTNISAGNINESSQSVSFTVTNDNNSLFSVQPAINSSGTLTYTPAANAVGTATVTVVAADDGGTANGGVNTSVSQTFTITLTAVSDNPIVSTATSALAYTVGLGATALNSGLMVSEPDGENINQATVTFTGNYQNGQDVLAFTNTANIAGSFNASTGVLTLSGTDTAANYQTALRSVTYHNTVAIPNTTSRTLTVTVRDQNNNTSSAQTVTIDLSVVNGTVFTWSGATGGSWSDPGNWDRNNIPVINSAVVIGDLTGSQTITYSSSDILTLQSITASETISISAGSMTVTSTSSLKDLTVSSTAKFHVSAGTTTITGVSTLSDTAIFQSTGTTTYNSPATLTLNNSSKLLIDGGTFTSNVAVNLNNTSTFEQTGGVAVMSSATMTLGSSTTFTLSGGEFRLNSGTLTASAALAQAGGALTGSGNINANLTVNGNLNPGIAGSSDIGTLTLTGNLTLGSTGVLNLEIGTTTTADKVVVNGNVDFTVGTLNVTLHNDFNGSVGMNYTYELVTYTGTQTGSFATKSVLGGNLTFDTNSADLAFTLSENTADDDIRTGLSNFTAQLHDFGSFYDLSNITATAPTIPVLPNTFNSAFNITSTLDALSLPTIANITSITLGDVVEVLLTAGYSVQEVAGGYTTNAGATIVDVTGDYTIKFTYSGQVGGTLNVVGGYSGATYNSSTADVLSGLSSSTTVTDTTTLSSALNVNYVFGLDSTGFFLFSDSALTLAVTASGTLGGNATISGASRALTGTSSANMNVSLRLNTNQSKYRLNELTSGVLAGKLVATAAGTTSLSVSFSVADASLSYTAAHTLTENISERTTSSTAALSLSGTLAIPNLKESDGTTTANVSLAGTYDSGTSAWTIAGSVSGDKKLLGLTVKSVAFSLSVTSTTFSGSGTLVLEADFLRNGSSPVSLSLSATITESSLTLSATATISSFTLNNSSNASLLSATDLSISASITVNFSTDTLTGSFTMSASSATLSPGGTYSAAITDGSDADTNAISGTYTIETQSFSLVMDQFNVTIGNFLTISTTNLTFALDRTNTAAHQTVLSVASITASVPALGLSASLTNFVVYQGGLFGATSASISIDANSPLFSLANFLPFKLSTISVTFLNWDTNSNNVLDSGEMVDLSQFELGLSGSFDFSKLSGLPFTPIIRIGPSGSQSSFQNGDGNTFNFSLRMLNNKVVPWNISDIEIGFSGLGSAEVFTVGGTIKLGGYQNGVWVNQYGGSLSVTAGSQMSDLSGSASGSILGSFDESTGSLAANISLTIGFKLYQYINVVGANVRFDLTAVTTTSPSFSLNVQSFKFDSLSVQSVTVTLGDYLVLNATNASFKFNPGTNEKLATFGSVTANITAVGLSGTVENFALDRDGSPHALANFGVTLSFDTTTATKMKWPSWFPIQVQLLKLNWADFDNQPENFKIVLSAKVDISALSGSRIRANGFVDEVEIDVGLLVDGKFPIVGIKGVGVEVGGEIAGAELSGTFFFSIAKLDSSGNLIADSDTTTTVADRVLYGGIQGAINIVGYGGFEIRLGISEYGPLQGYVKIIAPVVIWPKPPIMINSIAAGITFSSSLPNITDARALGTDPGFKSADDLTLDQWKSVLAQAISNAKKFNVIGAPSPLASLANGLMKIEGSISLSTPAGGSAAFQLDGKFMLDTQGKLLVGGDLQIGGTITINANLFFDLSRVNEGDAQVLMYAALPAEFKTLVAYGALQIETDIELPNFTPGQQINLTSINLIPSYLKYKLVGGMELRAFADLSLYVEGSVEFTFNLSLNSPSFEVEVNGRAGIGFLGDLVGIQGKYTVNFKGLQPPEVYGALILQPTDFNLLNAAGITNSNAYWLLRFNSTASVKTISLQAPGQSSAKNFDLAPISISILVEGYFIVKNPLTSQEWFRMNGRASITFTPTALSWSLDADVVVAGQTVFHALGFLQVNRDGIAAMIQVDLGDSSKLRAAHLSMSGSFVFIINTTEKDVRFTLPTEAPSVFGKREIVIDRAITNPDGSHTVVGPYAQIHGSGRLTLPGGLIHLNGNFSLQFIPGLIRFKVEANFAIGVENFTLYEYGVAASFDLDVGIVEAIDLRLRSEGDTRGRLGFDFDGSFKLLINTTNQRQVKNGIVLDAGIYARIQADATMHLGFMRLNGQFKFELGLKSIEIEAQGTLGLYLGTREVLSFHVSGGFFVGFKGISAAIAISRTSDFPSFMDLSIEGSYMLLVNTTGENQRIGSVTISHRTIYQVEIRGRMKALGITLEGGYGLEVVDSGNFRIFLNATLALKAGSLNALTFNVSGEMQIKGGGLLAYLDVSLSRGLPSNFKTSMSGSFKLRMNSSGDTETMSNGTRISARTFQVEFNGHMEVLGARMEGSFLFRLSRGDVLVSVDGHLNFPGVFKLRMRGDFWIFGSGIVVEVWLDSSSFKTPGFTVNGRFKFELNTLDRSFNGIAARSVYVALVNASFGVQGSTLSASGTIIMGINDGGFRIEIPSSNPFRFQALGVFDGRVYGYLDSRGEVLLTGTASIDYGSTNRFAIRSRLDITISTGGFRDVWVAESVSYRQRHSLADLQNRYGFFGGYFQFIDPSNLERVVTPGYYKKERVDAGVHISAAGRLYLFGRKIAELNGDVRATSRGYRMYIHGDVNVGGVHLRETMGVDVGRDYFHVWLSGGVRMWGLSGSASYSFTFDNGRFTYDVSGRVGFDYSLDIWPLAGHFRGHVDFHIDERNASASYRAEAFGRVWPFEARLNLSGGIRWDSSRLIVNFRIVGKNVEVVIGRNSGVYLSNISGATVFLDTNKNNILDEFEPFTIANADGSYDFDYTEDERTALFAQGIEITNLGKLNAFDANNNGKIDVDEGIIIVTGGTDLDNGLANTTTVKALASGYGAGVSNTANPFTSLQVALVEQGVSETEAITQVADSLGISFTGDNVATLSTFNPRDANNMNDASRSSVLSGATQINTIMSQTESLLGGGADTQNAAAQQLAVLIQNSGGSLDLTNQENVQQVLSSTAAATGSSVSAETIAAASQVVANTNQIVKLVAETSGSAGIDKVLSEVKAANQTKIASSLKDLASGKLSTQDFLNNLSSDKLVSSIFVSVSVPAIEAVLTNISVSVSSQTADETFTLIQITYASVLFNRSGSFVEFFSFNDFTTGEKLEEVEIEETGVVSANVVTQVQVKQNATHTDGTSRASHATQRSFETVDGMSPAVAIQPYRV